jgi:hypothetical protein
VRVSAPLLQPRELTVLHEALQGFTPDAVLDVLGPVGQAGLDRGDLLLAARQLPQDEPIATLTRLFLLGEDVPAQEARAVLGGLTPADAPELLQASDYGVRARLEIRPYAEAGAESEDGRTWLVVSDWGSDVRHGPLASDHVLGIGSASLTLAQYTMRTAVGRSLDVGTGCGVQALHLARHSDSVTATDVSGRALRMAATTAALSGQSWDLREGSLLDPIGDERYDLVVANPPFVVSSGLTTATGGYDYRDSGLAGDELCRRLVTSVPGVLREGGAAQLLANWVITATQPWQERLAEWLAPAHCDAWVWQREIADPAQYVSLWLRDAGEQPGTARWRAGYDEWLDWMATVGIVAIGMGAITLWNNQSDQPVIVMEDVPQAVEQPVGATVAEWLPRQRYLANAADAELLDARLRIADGVVLTRHDLIEDGAWRTALFQLRQSGGMRWELETDDSVSAVLAACNGQTRLRTALAVLAASLGLAFEDVAEPLLPVVRDLVARGFLLP